MQGAKENPHKFMTRALRKVIKLSLQTFLFLSSPVLNAAVARRKEYFAQPIFIVGAPRTGSTALYQALTNAFDVAYIDNLAAMLYKNLPAGIWLSSLAYGNRPHNNFKANFGNTQGYGWHAPSECGQFWYRWLPAGDHFVDKGSVTKAAVEEICSEIKASQNIARLPLLFKNLNAGQRLRLLHEAFPQARIIYIKRDPRFTAASIIRARHKNKVAPDDWWSIKPKNFRQLLKLEEEEMAIAQVYYLEKQIEKDLALFEPQNVRVVYYNELSEGCVGSIGEWLGLTKKPGGLMPDFFQDSPDKLDADQKSKLTQLAQAYAFSKDAFI